MGCPCSVELKGCLLYLWPHPCRLRPLMALSKPCEPYYPHFIHGKLMFYDFMFHVS